MDQKPNSEQKKTGPSEQKPSPKGDFSVFRFLLFMGVVMLFFTYLFKSNVADSRVRIPYSEFKARAAQGGVTEVTFKGKSLTGTFAKEYTKVVAKDTLRYHTFATTMPDVDDPDLMPLLEKNHVTINAESSASPWWSMALILVLPWILILGFFFYAGRKVPGQQGTGDWFGIGKSRAKRFLKEISSIKYKDVAGLVGAKTDLQEIVQYLKDPAKFGRLGASIPRGILLIGPPGTGKTLLAKATAGEANVPFFSTSGSEFIEMFVGVGASRVRDMFGTAKKEAPAIIFIDELDSVGQMRGTGLGGGHDEREQTLNQILSEMDGFEPHESLVVMAATNRPDVLDPALTRPGRFDRQIALDLPQKQARLEILKIHTRRVPLAEDVDLENVASRTIGFSGADLHNLANEAALLAGRKGKDKVGMTEFEDAQDKILLGAEREEKLDEKKKTRGLPRVGPRPDG